MHEYVHEDEVWGFLKTNKRLQLPTLHNPDDSSPNWCRDITLKYIDVMIADEKQKKLLTADKPKMRRKYLPSPVRGRGTAASAVVDEVAKKLNQHLAFLIASLFPPHQSDFV